MRLNVSDNVAFVSRNYISIIKSHVYLVPTKRLCDLWYGHTTSERHWEWYRYQMESIVPCRNVHTGLRQEQAPLLPMVPVPFPVPFPFSVNKPQGSSRFTSTHPQHSTSNGPFRGSSTRVRINSGLLEVSMVKHVHI